MTLLLMAAGALAAAGGTRLAALGFMGAALVAATGDAAISAVAVWTAALAAGWTLLARSSPRSLAIPALGAAAVVGSAAVENAAAVLGLWAVGTGAAVLGRGAGAPARRWALSLCAADALFLAAMFRLADGGLAGWPATLDRTGMALLLISAAMRIPLAAGADDRSAIAGLLVVRAQAAVLLFLVASTTEPSLDRVMAIGGAIVFAATYAAARRTVVDGCQELALLAVALGTSGLGWGPRGWGWGALAAGTLMHYLRVMVGRGTPSRWADALTRSAGIGLPFLPVVLSQLEGAARARSSEGVLVVLGLLVGLAARTRQRPAAARKAISALEPVRVWLVFAAAAAAALSATALSSPRPPAGESIGWPPLWATAVVVVAAVLGATVKGVITAERRPPVPFRVPALGPRLALLDRVSTARVLWACVGALAVAALAFWVVGSTRGFL